MSLEAGVHRDQLVGAHAALRVAVVEEEHLGKKDRRKFICVHFVPKYLAYIVISD